jgi:hypothetical protein
MPVVTSVQATGVTTLAKASLTEELAYGLALHFHDCGQLRAVQICVRLAQQFPLDWVRQLFEFRQPRLDMELSQHSALPSKAPPTSKGGSKGAANRGGNTPTGPRPSKGGGPSGSKSTPTPSKKK